VFGERPFSWTCLYRSVLASCITALICGVLLPFARPFEARISFLDFVIAVLVATLAGNAVLDYISLLSTRYALAVLTMYRSIMLTLTILLADLAVTFTSIWLWLYAGSGFLLKAARRFDIGFAWFNHKFDIEKKPLYCMGILAGAFVSIAIWSWGIVHFFLK
jgi:formate/nitrite transporter FocA (FNT family)